MTLQSFLWSFIDSIEYVPLQSSFLHLIFIEEIETGVHPSRINLLVQLIEQQVKNKHIQVVVTTHSPQLLSYLSDESLNNAVLVYRLAGQPDAHIKRIMDIPEVPRLVKEREAATLLSMGWFEQAMEFTAEEPSSSWEYW